MSVNVNDNGTLKRIAGGTLYADAPIGTIQAYGGAIDSSHSAPSGWLLCDGSGINIDDYAELYAIIGNAFGTASVNTKFVLPDLRGKFAEGLPASGKTLGEGIDAGLPNITGYFNADYLHHGGGVWNGAFDKFVDSGRSQLMGSGSGTTTNAVHFDASKSNSIYGKSDTVQPPAVCVNYIIKAKQVGLPADLLSDLEEKMQWKLLGTYTGKNAIALPSGWKEVQIIGMAHDSRDRNDICMEVFFHASALTELSQTEMKISSTRYRLTEQQGIQYTFTASTVSLDYLYYQNGTDVGDSSKSVVYYK